MPLRWLRKPMADAPGSDQQVPRYKRVVLKLSGEVLMGDGEFSIPSAADANVVAMHRFQLGEGIEKAASDFAAEVAAQANG